MTQTAAATEAATTAAGERKILVAVDEGEESMHALSWCLENVASGGEGSRRDTVIVLYAVPQRPVYAPMIDGTGYIFSKEILDSIDKHSNEVADSVIRTAKSVCNNFPHVKVETKAQKGDARDVICEMVEKLKCDMVVLGSHGFGLVKRYTEHHARTHETDIGYLITEEFGEGTAKQDKVVADSVIAMARNVCDNFPNVKVETEVQKGDPREVICETVERLKCDMVALECHGYGAIKRTFLRCVSDYCAHNANCSVLIVKKREQMISGEDLYVLGCECSCVRELGSLCVIRSCKGDMYGKLV